MGPHSFECGNLQVDENRVSLEGQLQWGRTRSSAEMSIPAGSRSICPASLQWGRTRSSAEIDGPRVIPPAASMGPHSFECGNEPGTQLPQRRIQRFNGAALVRVRKSSMRWLRTSSPSRLQWGRTRSSAEMWLLERFFGCRGLASMGPHSFECGNGSRRPSIAPRAACFNGAALVRVRKSRGERCRTTATRHASMGPHSFECGNSAMRRTSRARIRFNGAALVRVRKSLAACQTAPKRSTLQWGRTRSSAEMCRCSSSCGPMRAASMGPHSFECGNPIRRSATASRLV